MQTFCIQFLDSRGHVLDTQFITSTEQALAAHEALRRTTAKGFEKIEATVL